MLLPVVALALGACSDVADYDASGDDTSDVSGVRMLRLSVGGGVTVGPAETTTRSTNLNFQNDTFAAGTEIGIFILKEGDYEKFLEASDKPYGDGGRTDAAVPEMGGNADDYSSYDAASGLAAQLIADAYRDGRTYGYQNVKACINDNGEIERTDGLGFIYPLHASDRVAVMAYAPYNEAITYTDLKRGIPAAVQTEQVSDAAMQQSDLLFGTPSVGNPLREGDDDMPVDITFRHVMSSVQLHLNITNTPGLRSDSIIVTMRNVVVADTLLPMLTAAANSGTGSGEGIFFGAPLDVSAVTMARVKGLAASSDAETSLDCNALIPPQTLSGGLHTVFEITFKNRAGGLADTTVVRTDTRDDVTFRSGKQNIYRAYLPSMPSDDTVTLPDEGKDDVILGAPKQ